MPALRSGKSVRRRVIAIQDRKEPPPRILVVDDHPENRGWPQKLLASVGFVVRWTDKGEAAIGVWREWRGAPQGRETIIVALTAGAMDDDRRAVALSGADDLLSQPCREGELVEKMRRLLKVTDDYEEPENTDGPSAETASRLTSEKLGQLPQELIDEIREATLSGNKNLLDKLAAPMQSLGDTDSVWGLQAPADKYDLYSLNELLEEACQN
jgi:CheY-like chemotaxis protein